MTTSTTADQYCVMGNPVAHSRSPWIHSRFAELTGQTLVYELQTVPLDGFAQALTAAQTQGLKGCNVTVPFKLQAFELATVPSERSKLALACNTLLFSADGVRGYNTDGVGLVRDITLNAGVSLAGRRVLLLGAGGAAAGVLGPLLAEKPAQLVVTNRTQARAVELVDRHQPLAKLHHCELSARPREAITGLFDLVINGTASSLTGGGVPAPDGVLAPGALAYDMMYGPSAQSFLAWARAQGATARDGLGMLVEQAAVAFEIWRGVRPPSGRVLAELQALLTQPGA